jgi:hypothetical protein
MSEHSMPVSNRYVHAATFGCLMMMVSVLWFPSQLGALAQAFGFGSRTLGLLGSAEIGGFLLGTVAGSILQLGKMRPWVIAGGAIAIAANIALILYMPALPFLVMRPFASFGGGLAFAYALGMCSRSVNPTRSFGIFTGLMSIGMMIGFQLVGQMLQHWASADAAANAEGATYVVHLLFSGYVVLALGAILVYLCNAPTIAPVPAASPTGAKATAPWAVFVALAAIGLSFVAQGSVFAFLQTMGVSRGFPVAGVANAMSAWPLFGVVGAFGAGAVPVRVPRWVLIGLASLAMLGGYIALYMSSSLFWYAVGCAVGGLYWNFILPLMLGLMARIDTSGRSSVWGGSLTNAGSMTGASVAGLLVVGTQYTPVAWVSAALMVAAFVGIALAECSRAR